MRISHSKHQQTAFGVVDPRFDLVDKDRTEFDTWFGASKTLVINIKLEMLSP